MSVFIDLILLAIFIICIFLGYKKGLVGLVLKLCSFILALVISLILFKPVSNFVIDNTSFYDNIKTSIVQIANTNISTPSEENKDTNSEFLVKYINNSIKEATEESREYIVESVADSLARNIISIAVLIILFVILRILLIFIKIITDAITELPIIKQFNKSGGIIYGIIQALFIIYIAFAIIALFIKNTVLTQAINDSYIGSMFYNNNLILMLFLK